MGKARWQRWHATAPQWRWRGGDKQIDVRMFALANNVMTVSAFELVGDRLSFSVTRPNTSSEIECTLTRQSERLFSGRCQETNGGLNALIEMAPPEPPPPSPAR